MRPMERKVKFGLVVLLSHGGDIEVVALCFEGLKPLLKFFEDGKERFILQHIASPEQTDMQRLRLVQICSVVVNHVHIFKFIGSYNLFCQKHPDKFVCQFIDPILALSIYLRIDHCHLLTFFILVESGKVVYVRYCHCHLRQSLLNELMMLSHEILHLLSGLGVTQDQFEEGDVALVVSMLFNIRLLIFGMGLNERSNASLYILDDGAIFGVDEGDAREVSEEGPFSHDVLVFESHLFFYQPKNNQKATISSCFQPRQSSQKQLKMKFQISNPEAPKKAIDFRKDSSQITIQHTDGSSSLLKPGDIYQANQLLTIFSVAL